MIFVYGGLYNGQLEYVKNNYNIIDKDIYDFSTYDYKDISDLKEICDKYRCLYNINFVIKSMIKNAVDIKVLYDTISKYKDRDIILVSDDISCGVIPVEKVDRIYREEVSKLSTYISSISTEVYRVFVGIVIKIK